MGLFSGGLFSKAKDIVDKLPTPANLLSPTIDRLPAITPAQNLFSKLGLTNTDLARLAAGAGGFSGLGGGETFHDEAMSGGFDDPLSGLSPVDLGEEVFPFTTDPSVADLGGAIDPATGFPVGGVAGGAAAGTSVFGNPLSSLLKGVGGGGALNTAAALAPIIAAISYARNQGPFNTGRFEDLYSKYSPEAMTGQYDLNTGLERSALTNSLASRGLSGSTFGNEALTNFGTARDVGRSELLSKAALGAGQLASPILDADIKSRLLKNDLYGRALLALGNVFGGRNSGGGGKSLTDQLLGV